MLGIRLFLHAIRMILGNFPTALRISAPMLIIIILGAFTQPDMTMPMEMTNADGQLPQLLSPGEAAAFGTGILVLAIVALILFLWTAVAWHRFILLEELPGGLLPRWNGAAIWRYFKAAFLYGVIMILVTIPFVLIGGVTIVPIAFGSMGPVAGAILAGIFIYVPLIVIGYRLIPILPSAAVGPRLTIGETWNATSAATWSFIVLAVITFLVSFVLMGITVWLMRVAMPLGILWYIATQWISVLFGISILTTIYGHFVQKRELNV